MDLSDKNILNVYKNYNTSSYIINNFTDAQQFGNLLPNAKEPFGPKKLHLPLTVIDNDNEYEINELGLRGKLNKDAEILALGCSYTFGVGVPEDGTWPSILGSEINKDVLNLGVAGITIKKISELVIRYVSKNNKPKTIFALFPPFFRTSLISDIDFYSSLKNINPREQEEIKTQTSFKIGISYNRSTKEMFFEKQEFSPYSKSKEKGLQYMENIFSPHQLVSDSIDSISTIQDFCYSHGINFYWSTWDNPSSMLMDVLVEIPNFKLKNYIKFADDKFNNYFTNDSRFPNNLCNLSHNSKFTDHPSWDIGSDALYSYGKRVQVSSHPGIHFQHHVADLFKGYSTS